MTGQREAWRVLLKRCRYLLVEQRLGVNDDPAGRRARCFIEFGPQHRLRAEAGHQLGQQQAGKVSQAGGNVGGLN
ncbi:MAG TPA: hypothetical protein VGI66_02970 [Streptosporangiaceae bacterium]|jgi:hypothetical protein